MENTKWWIREYNRQTYCNFKPTKNKYVKYFYTKLPKSIQSNGLNNFEVKPEYIEEEDVII